MKKTLEEAVNEISGVHPDWDKLECFKMGFKEGAGWQANQSSWISVEERLPNIIDDLGESEYVLVIYKDCIPIVAQYCTDEYHFCPSFKVGGKKFVSHWWTDNHEWIKHEITHWMPIPSFNEILEANKDVLQRMKEKGD